MDDEPTGYSQIRLKNFWLRGDSIHYQPFRRALNRLQKPSAIICEESSRSLSLPLLLAYARKKNIPRLLWGHFSSNNRVVDPSTSWRDRYRIRMARSADACICYTDGIRDILRPYVPDEKLFVARNTVDLSQLLPLGQKTDLENQTTSAREVLREKLGIRPAIPIVAYLGRLIPAKRTDLVVQAFIELRKRQDAALLIIGEGPTKPEMEKLLPGDIANDVHFVGATMDPKIFGPMLALANVGINPGRLGLSVNHCFAAGLPLVSAKSPDGTRYHSPEGEFVHDRENGRLVEVLSPEALADGIQDVLADNLRYSKNAWRYAAEQLSIDTMVGGIVDAIRHVTTDKEGPRIASRNPKDVS